MTNQEAINHLNMLINEVYNEDFDGYESAKALDMAIEALRQPEQKHGRWIYDRLLTTNGSTYGVNRCSECESYYKEIDGAYWYYCPNCGAMMLRGEEYETD